jgi:DNA-binding NarL/FixJ family response regulator
VQRRDGGLAVGVRDDGVGGADPSAGSGIAGLQDRVRALNGRFVMSSPPGQRHGAERLAAMRVIVADDSAVIREGVVNILGTGGATVVGQARTADELLALVDELVPDLAVVDIRMPPSDTAGLRAAVRIRDGYRGRVGVLVLSQFLEPEYALMLLAEGTGGIGYLLKDRVAATGELIDAARRVASGGSAIDPAVVEEVVRGRLTQQRLEVLTPREREVLGLVAEGRSNRSVAERLSLSVKTVEAQVATIFSKLGLEEHPDDNRRVLAVLAYLDGRT